jgi:hypothetical protein
VNECVVCGRFDGVYFVGKSRLHIIGVFHKSVQTPADTGLHNIPHPEVEDIG